MGAITLSIVKKIKQEIKSVIPAIIYFAIAFNLIYFTVGLSLEPGEVRYFTPLFVNMGALIAGKVLIIANALPFINVFPHKPLIYNILWKLFIYTLCIYIFWVIETLFHLADKYKKIDSIFQHLKLDMMSPLFWSAMLWLIAVFLIFVIFSEFIRVLGKDKILKILLGPN